MSPVLTLLVFLLSLLESEASFGPRGKYSKHIGDNVCVQVDWLNEAVNAAQQINILVICGQDEDDITLGINMTSFLHYEIADGSYAAYVDFMNYIEHGTCRGIIKVDPGDLRDYDYITQDNNVRTRFGPEPYEDLASGPCKEGL